MRRGVSSRPQYTQAKQSDSDWCAVHRLAVWGWWWDTLLAVHTSAGRAEESAQRVPCADPRETRRDPWTVGPTCIPQETAMSRRVSPCGLGGIIGGHQVACWPLLSGRMVPLRWFLGLPVMDFWSWVSAAVAACLLRRRPWPPAPSLCSYKAMYHSAVTPPLAPCRSALGV